MATIKNDTAMAKKTTINDCIAKQSKALAVPQNAVILKQCYEGRCGGIMKYAASEVILAVFSSLEAFDKFWFKNFKEPFSFGNPYDPNCRRDGCYLERTPLITENANMKKMLSYIHPVKGFRNDSI